MKEAIIAGGYCNGNNPSRGLTVGECSATVGNTARMRDVQVEISPGGFESKIVRRYERSIPHYTNRDRRKRRLRRVQGHQSLIRAARTHSWWMARSRRKSHTGGRGSHPWDRATRAGFPSKEVADNLWQTSGRSARARMSRFTWRSDWKLGQAAVITWMKSPGHRANLLNPNWRSLGVGLKVPCLSLAQNHTSKRFP